MPWTDKMFSEAIVMPDWGKFISDVNTERKRRFEALREAEADRLALVMDMTPEGFVREWAKRGFPNNSILSPWEHAYNRVGLLQAAVDKGYIRIGSDVACTVALEAAGKSLL